MFSRTTTELSMSRGKRQCQAAKNHAVDRRSRHLKNDESRQNRKGDREEDGDRGPQAAEKNQDHDAGKEQADSAFVQQRLDGGLHKPGLIEETDRLMHGSRNVDQMLKLGPGAIGHRDRYSSCLPVSALADRQNAAR